MFETASNYAESVDEVMLVIVIASVVFTVGVTIVMLYFLYKYHRDKHPVAVQIKENAILEFTWIVIPTISMVVLFWYSYVGYQELRADVDGAYEVKVHAFMWGWNFEYPNGKQSDTLYISLDKKTKLIMTSRDVVHSLFIPAFRLKEDVIRGRNTYMILQPKVEGSFDIACAEYCGVAHSNMYTKLNVVSDTDFERWLDETDDDNAENKLDNNQENSIKIAKTNVLKVE